MPIPNAAAVDFLASRRSFPAKLMAAPSPDRDALRAILAVGLRVPDHGKLEPWRLVIVERPAMARLADLAETIARDAGGDDQRVAKGRGQFDLGQLAVVVISAPQPSDKVPQIEQLLSAGSVCFGILNAATAAGWGANWLTGWVAYDRKFIETAFGCTADESVVGIVHIATPAVELAPDRPRPDPDRVSRWLAR